MSAAEPTKSQVHIDGPLTQISIAYMNEPSAFIAAQVFPIVPVDKQSDKYFIFDKSAFMRDQAKKRGDAQESAGSGYRLSNDSYYCDVWALHKDIGDQTRANTDSPLSSDRNAVQFVTNALMLRREKLFVDAAFATGIWGTSATPSAQWSDFVSSDPLADFETAKETVLVSTGREANTAVLGYQVFTKLKLHPDIKEMLKYTSSRVVTEEILAGLIGVQRVLVPKVVSDGNSDGATAASMAFMYGKHALLCHVPSAPGIETPSAGYIFAWRGLNGAYGDAGIGFSKFRIDLKKCDRVEGEMAIDVKVTGADLGYFFPNAVV